MRKLALIPIALLTLLTLTPLAAQDATPQPGWLVEQHCIGDPTPPPDGWTYDGTIFVNDDVGIHALNPKIKTPHIVLFRQEFTNGAALSPDGKWYAFRRDI